MAEVIHTRRARADLKRIWTYIALDSGRAADKLLADIQRKIERLSLFPESGSPREDIRAGGRLLVHGRYVVLYHFDEEADRVRIVAVLEGDRDISGLI